MVLNRSYRNLEGSKWKKEEIFGNIQNLYLIKINAFLCIVKEDSSDKNAGNGKEANVTIFSLRHNLSKCEKQKE